jgi:phage terminase large subunit-like protein
LTGSPSNNGPATPTRQLLSRLTHAELSELAAHWPMWARPDQLPPQSDWTTWLMLGGRGSGKTRAGAEWVRGLATSSSWAGPKITGPIALVSETISAARAVMVEGVSGLLSVHPHGQRPLFHRARNELEWPSGMRAQLFGAADPQSLRGPQFGAAWCDELAKWTSGQAAWDMLQFGLRLGTRPRQLVTTTPRPCAHLKRILADSATVITRAKTSDNADNLSPAFLGRIVERYRGSVLGRQELDGELIEDDPDALWNRSQIGRARLETHPELERIIVAIDPPVTGHARSDACGIIVAGRAKGRAYVLEDASIWPAAPYKWAKRATQAYHQHDADCIVAEVNQGGDMIANMIAQADPAVPVRAVRATRGKWTRAEPVATLYARGLVHHCGFLPELEDEMCAFGRDGRAAGKSPDRVDALVWALTELVLGPNHAPRIRGV